jgi:3alpha(or 20beta)-hydroxysteroid dehydrogenase
MRIRREDEIVSMRFADHVMVVTGASSGMGADEARALASEGAHVWVADINDDAGQALVDEIRANGGAVSYHHLDVTQSSQWANLATAIRQTHDRLDGLVNNAGVSHRVGIADTSDDDWQRVLAVNLTGPFLGMRTLAPLMAASGGGAIVNVSSIAGMLGYFAAAYGASKWGLRGLTKTGALEFAPLNVRVNSIHPGLVDTPLLRAGGDTAFIDESLLSIPAGRTATVDETSAIVLFLLSTEARYITGQEIVIDGGMTAGGIYWRITNELRQCSAAERRQPAS